MARSGSGAQRGHELVWAFDRPDTGVAAEAAIAVERAFARVEDAMGALQSCWRALHEAGVAELRLCDRLTVLSVVRLPLQDAGDGQELAD